MTSCPSDAPDPDHDRPPLREAVLRDRLLAPAGPLADVRVVARTGSTNTDLAAALREPAVARAGSVLLATEHQVDGRGRSGRAWRTPAGAALTFSLSLRPLAPPERWGWLPLLVGLGVARAVRSLTGVPAAVKWPNDLLVDLPHLPPIDGWGTERKLGGILVELVTTQVGPTAVAGVGLNVSQTADELPVPTAASLTGAGAGRVDREELLVGCVEAVTGLVGRWDAAAGDAGTAGLVDEVAAACATLGRAVRVELPADVRLEGVATGLGADGALLLLGGDGRVHAVRAGDVRHLRAAGGAGAG